MIGDSGAGPPVILVAFVSGILGLIAFWVACIRRGAAITRDTRSAQRALALQVAGALFLLIVVGVLMVIPLYNGVQSRARIAKAEADVQSMATAVSMYVAQMGTLPGAVSLVTASSRNARGQTAGAFLAAIPTPPSGWSPAYTYATSADGTFTVSATGDGMTVRVTR